MTEIQALTEGEIIELAHKWYYSLNTHAPLKDFLNMLTKQGLKMKFPESNLEGLEAFKEWHKSVTHRFFDQDHNIKCLSVTIKDNVAIVKVLVRWQAKTWQPPAAKSSWLGYDAYQTWEVIRDPDSGKPVIRYYSVDSFMPMEGTN